VVCPDQRLRQTILFATKCPGRPAVFADTLRFLQYNKILDTRSLKLYRQTNSGESAANDDALIVFVIHQVSRARRNSEATQFTLGYRFPDPRQIIILRPPKRRGLIHTIDPGSI
jgi:hypothetical protein